MLHRKVHLYPFTTSSHSVYFQHVLQMKVELDKLMEICTYWVAPVEENYSIAFMSHLGFFLMTFDHVQFFTNSGFESLTLVK